MSAYLQKEIRLLLPSFGIALVLAFCVWLMPSSPQSEFSLRALLAALPLFLCPALVVMTALDSFGREISSGTLANLLAQPVSRSRIWWTKTTLLALSLLTVFCVWWISFFLHLPDKSWSGGGNEREMFGITALVLFTVYSGGLWSVLFFRQVGAAFWFTLLAPAALAVFTNTLTEKYGDELHAERNIVIVLATYGIAGFFWAKRLFQNAQDVQWTGGEIKLPGWIKMPRVFSGSIKFKGRHPRLALLVKEFQLHQSSFVIAAVLAILHGSFIIARNVRGGFKDSWGLEFFSYQFWILWVVMPLLIGCTAVAEERKLGTLEGQLCLPARRWTQFIAKFGVAFVLAIFFGMVVPVLFEGDRILPNFHNNIEAFGKDDGFVFFGKSAVVAVEFLKSLEPVLPYMPLLIFSVCFFCIAFYASTLARNTLQAVAPAILGVIIAWALLLGAGLIKEWFANPLWRGWLIYIIGVPVLALTLAWLTWWNFKRVLVGAQVWRRNILVFLASLALVMAVTTATYQRGWELFMQLEPAHGPARLTQSALPMIRHDGNRMSVHLADGRAWSTFYMWNVKSPWDAILGNWKMEELFGGGRFIPGTNWQAVAFCARDVLALDKNGRLWVSEKPENWQDWKNTSTPREPVQLVQYGNGSDWKTLIGDWTAPFAIKNDGTLWRIGTNRFDGKKEWPGLRAFEPQRIGNDSDWAEFINGYSLGTAYRKTDGQVFHFQYGSPKPKDAIRLDENSFIQRAPHLEGHQWRGFATTYGWRFGQIQVGVSEDGKLRALQDYQTLNHRIGLNPNDGQIGQETNWVTVAGQNNMVVTLKSDGTLWQWEFGENPGNVTGDAKATQLGTKSDWVAVSSAPGGIVSLAADGSLWQWRFDSRFYDVMEFRPLLRSSRKPQLIGNIFAKSE